MSTWPGTCFLGEFGNGVAFIRQAFNATIQTPLPGSPSVFVVYAGDSVVIPPGNVGGVDTLVTISVPAGFSGRLSNIPGCNISCTSTVSKDLIYGENKNLRVVLYNHSFS